MPPPPPPSKSYLIQINDLDLSSDEDDVEYEQEQQQQQSPRLLQPIVKPPLMEHQERIHNHNNNSNSNSVFRETSLLEKPDPVTRKDTPETYLDNEDNDDDEDNDSEDEYGAVAVAAARKAKKNRKKKQNKKRKKQQAKQLQQQQQQAVGETTIEIIPNKKRIHFSTVQVISFDRCLGTGVVPLDGGWPLGLGQALPEAAPAVELSLDDFETAKRARLAHRWKQYCASTAGETIAVPETLETRQLDYKSKAKNPLFGLITERQRMVLLLGEKDLDDVLIDRYKKEQQKLQQQQAKTKDSKSSPSNGNNGNKHSGKHRNSHGGGNSPSSSNRHRSGSKGGSLGGIFSNHERYNDTFTEYEVHHVRNELEQYRNQRSLEGAHGCTCRRLDVYIPPPGAGKKAAHRRLSTLKVKEELRKRHALPEDAKQKTREELELLLAQIVAQEPCCRDDNQCPCVKNGIDCQSDACQCWHASHQVKTHNNNTTDPITPQVIRTRCGNKFGMTTVDPDVIDEYRKTFVTWWCKPVAAAPAMTMTAIVQT